MPVLIAPAGWRCFVTFGYLRWWTGYSYLDMDLLHPLTHAGHSLNHPCFPVVSGVRSPISQVTLSSLGFGHPSQASPWVSITHINSYQPQSAVPSLGVSLHAWLLAMSSLMGQSGELLVASSSQCLDIEPTPSPRFPSGPLHGAPLTPHSQGRLTPAEQMLDTEPHQLQPQLPPSPDSSNAGSHLSSFTRDNKASLLHHTTRGLSDKDHPSSCCLQSHTDKWGNNRPVQSAKTTNSPSSENKANILAAFDHVTLLSCVTAAAVTTASGW